MSIFATNATKPSILQNIQLNETVNTDILNRLINSNLLKLKGLIVNLIMKNYNCLKSLNMSKILS